MIGKVVCGVFLHRGDLTRREFELAERVAGTSCVGIGGGRSLSGKDQQGGLGSVSKVVRAAPEMHCGSGVTVSHCGEQGTRSLPKRARTRLRDELG